VQNTAEFTALAALVLAVLGRGHAPLKQRTYHSDDFVLSLVVGRMAH
jgi:hypothetical protein